MAMAEPSLMHHERMAGMNLTSRDEPLTNARVPPTFRTMFSKPACRKQKTLRCFSQTNPASWVMLLLVDNVS